MPEHSLVEMGLHAGADDQVRENSILEKEGKLGLGRTCKSARNSKIRAMDSRAEANIYVGKNPTNLISVKK